MRWRGCGRGEVAGALVAVGLLIAPARAEPPGDPLTTPATVADPGAAGARAIRLEAQGRYEEAADAHDEALRAAGWRGGDAAEHALRLAQLRLALGEAERVAAVVAELERRPGAVPPATLALLVLMLSDRHQRRGEAAAVLGALGPARLERLGAAPADLRVRLHAARGRALLTLGRQREAYEEFARVEALWPGHALASAAIRATIGAEPPGVAASLGAPGEETVDRRVQRRLGTALEAVSEALFRRADGAVPPAATAPPPRYRGSGDDEAIRRFVDGEVKRWMQARLRALGEATTGYKAVVDLQPVPSPIWVVEAAARVGELWGDFAMALQGVPMPPRVRRDPELARTYRAALTEATAPWLASARGAMETCVSYAARYQIASPASDRCVAWLGRHFPERYPPLDELRPAPGWSPPLRPQEAPLGADARSRRHQYARVGPRWSRARTLSHGRASERAGRLSSRPRRREPIASRFLGPARDPRVWHRADPGHGLWRANRPRSDRWRRCQPGGANGGRARQSHAVRRARSGA